MRYLLALVCPPVAVLVCKKWFQAIFCGLLFALAIASAKYGVGAVIEFFLILWAFHVVGDSKAAVETQIFVDTVEPIPFIRS